MSHKYKLTTEWCWYHPSESGTNKYVVKMYFVEGYPYTFDDLAEVGLWDPLLEEKANSHQNGKVYTPEDMWRVSTYLVMEEAHPCIFPMLVDRPELLPSD
jgi:hypothetical protein